MKRVSFSSRPMAKVVTCGTLAALEHSPDRLTVDQGVD